MDAKAPEVDRKINHNLCQLKITQPISIKVESFEFEDQITGSIKRVLPTNLNLEPGYLWLEVRRTRFVRAITSSISGFERTRMGSGSLMLIPIEG